MSNRWTDEHMDGWHYQVPTGSEKYISKCILRQDLMGGICCRVDYIDLWVVYDPGSSLLVVEYLSMPKTQPVVNQGRRNSPTDLIDI